MSLSDLLVIFPFLFSLVCAILLLIVVGIFLIKNR